MLRFEQKRLKQKNKIQKRAKNRMKYTNAIVFYLSAPV